MSDRTVRLVAIAVGCLLLAAALAVTLARADPRRVGANELPVDALLAGPFGSAHVCQDSELLPAGAGAVRISLAATGAGGGPRLTVVAVGAGGTLARGTLAAGWRGAAATVPLRPVARAPQFARICATVGPEAAVTVHGHPSASEGGPPSATVGRSAVGGRIHIDYLTPEPRTWWSQVGGIARRMGFGHALGGSLVAVAALLLTLAAATVALWQLARRTG
jgi:hypothetical protein